MLCGSSQDLDPSNSSHSNLNLYPSVDSIATISCFLSVCGGIGFFTLCFKYPKLRSTGLGLLLCVTVSDVITQISNLVTIVMMYHVFGSSYNGIQLHAVVTDEFDYYCRVVSCIFCASTMIVFFWTNIIAVYFVLGSLNRTKARIWMVKAAKYIFWMFPIVIIISGLDEFGIDEATVGTLCWIKEKTTKNKFFWRLMTVKLWEFMTYVLVTIALLIAKIREAMDSEERPTVTHRLINSRDHGDIDSSRDHIFLWIPIGFYFLRIWGSARFIIHSVCGDKLSHTIKTVDFIFMHFQAIGDNILTYFNFVIYCILNEDVSFHIFGRLKRDERHARPARISVVSTGSNTRNESTGYHMSIASMGFNMHVESRGFNTVNRLNTTQVAESGTYSV